MGATLSLDDAKAIVSETDTDKDGRISYNGMLTTTRLNYLGNCG